MALMLPTPSYAYLPESQSPLPFASRGNRPEWPAALFGAIRDDRGVVAEATPEESAGWFTDGVLVGAIGATVAWGVVIDTERGPWTAAAGRAGAEFGIGSGSGIRAVS